MLPCWLWLWLSHVAKPWKVLHCSVTWELSRFCVNSCQHFSVCEEAHRGGGREAAGAEACGRGHWRDEVTDGWVDKALLLPGSGHDSVTAEAAGLRLCAGAKTWAPFAPLCSLCFLNAANYTRCARLFLAGFFFKQQTATKMSTVNKCIAVQTT